MFFYDAKTQDKLPYWDYFPLCIPIKKYKNGFMGLNLHYLHQDIELDYWTLCMSMFQKVYLT